MRTRTVAIVFATLLLSALPLRAQEASGASRRLTVASTVLLFDQNAMREAGVAYALDARPGQPPAVRMTVVAPGAPRHGLAARTLLALDGASFDQVVHAAYATPTLEPFITVALRATLDVAPGDTARYGVGSTYTLPPEQPVPAEWPEPGSITATGARVWVDGWRIAVTARLADDTTAFLGYALEQMRASTWHVATAAQMHVPLGIPAIVATARGHERLPWTAPCPNRSRRAGLRGIFGRRPATCPASRIVEVVEVTSILPAPHTPTTLELPVDTH